MEKKQKLNLGKLIALLSCLGLLVTMVLGVALTKPLKAENKINSTNVGSYRAVSLLNKSGNILTGMGSGPAIFYFVSSSKSVDMSLTLGVGHNLEDFCKQGKLLYDTEYSVNFVSGVITSNKVYFNIKSSLPLPADPIKEGHTFKGWYYDAAFTRPYDGAPIYADTSLYAKFEVNKFTVTFNTDGGTVIAPQVVDWNSTPSVAPPTKAGHTFKGWFMGETLYSEQPIKADTTLTAKWEINRYTITFDSKGGTAVSNQVIEYGGHLIVNNAPTKEGYTFAHWERNGMAYNGYPIMEDMTFSAVWSINRYTVTYDSNGGTAVENITQDWNTSFTLPTPTREGYTFQGWFNGATKYTAAPLTANLNLTAQWEIIKYTVTFYVDGEIFTTLEINYGQGLGEAMAANGLLFFNVVDENGNNLGKAETITGEKTFLIAEMTQKEKVGAWIAQNDWILWASGGVIAALIIALIILIKKRG